MRLVLSIAPICFALVLAGAHCSTSSTSGGAVDGGADSSVADSGGGVDSAADGAATVNGCGAADFADHTDANDARAITFPTGPTPAQYSPPCMKIKVGQSVTWSGSFASHPLEPLAGSTNNPIKDFADADAGTTAVAFPTAGTFGFECANHPLSMLGAILVVP